MTDHSAVRESWRRPVCERAVAELRDRGQSAEVAMEHGCSHVVWTRADGSWWLFPMRARGGQQWAVRDHRKLWPKQRTMEAAIEAAKEA